MKVHEAVAHLCELWWARSVDYLHRYPKSDAYQHQAISPRVHLDVLGDVPLRHPRSHNAKWKQWFRKLDDRENVWVRIGLALFDHAAEYLARSELGTPPIE